MSTSYPTSIDTLTNPTSSDGLNSPSHADQHANANDAIEALQAKVGTDSSSVSTSLDYKITDLNSTVSAHISNTSNPHSVDADDVGCLSKTNTTTYTPSADYHPATKKYVDDNVASGAMTSFIVSGDSGTNQTITNGNILNIAGGTGLSTVVGATDEITVSLSDEIYTSTEKTKLSGIDTNADVTDATNVNAAGATMNSDTDVSANGWVIDEDDMTSDDATKVPTQQSVKAYVLSTSGSGEANTGSNVGTDGVGVYDAKDGVELQFRNIAPASNKITTTLNGKDIDIDVIESSLTLSNLSGSVTDSQVPDTITLSNITQIANRSHTDLSDIGTNTHTQIDSHISNTSNPHSVDIDDVTPTTTKGDILVENGSNVVRLPIGSNGQILTADSGEASGVKWGSAGGTGDMNTSTYDPASIAEQLVGLTAIQTLTNKRLTSPKINEDVAVTATATELNILDGATLTTTELNYVDGVTSAIQTQLNAKATDSDLTTHTGDTSNPHSVTKTQVGLGSVENTALSTWAGSGNITTVGTVTSGNVDGAVTDASTSTKGKVELATASEVTTGTSTTLAVTPDALAGSTIFGTKTVQVTCFDYTTDTATGDGKAYIHIPASLDGMNLIGVHAEVITAGTTGTTDIQIANVTDSVDMLSTKLTIDSGETGSDTAATSAVIDTTKDDVAINDLLRIDVDAVATTPAKGLIVTLDFRLP